MKFKVNDRFRVTENGLTGQIVGISFNSMFQANDYVVKWDHHPSEECYPTEECDANWVLDISCPVVTMRLPQALDHITIKIDTSGPVKVQCNGHHTWIECGFHFTKMVCKHCDIEQGKQ